MNAGPNYHVGGSNYKRLPHFTEAFCSIRDQLCGLFQVLILKKLKKLSRHKTESFLAFNFKMCEIYSSTITNANLFFSPLPISFRCFFYIFVRFPGMHSQQTTHILKSLF